ncbi:RNA polymerase sigma factor [Yunchengibacter salinarum]|uniref:RNA polymerase sigma factor n=1 Tax=Yunchengibacter salinarum TaxID=3133399 RepID=UPI0035B574CD
MNGDPWVARGGTTMVRVFLDQQSSLRAQLMRRLGNQDDVLDVLQDLFIKLSELGDADHINDPVHYLRRSAHNLAVDRLRERTRQKPVISGADGEAHLANLPSSAATPERVADQRQRLAAMRAALDDLPRDCRDAFLLSRRDGLTYAEIGARLGVSANMVKKHLTRALAHLRGALARG